jgi:hypothetical protein
MVVRLYLGSTQEANIHQACPHQRDWEFYKTALITRDNCLCAERIAHSSFDLTRRLNVYLLSI